MISSSDLPSIAEEVKRRQEVAEGMSHTSTSLELSTEVYRRLMERKDGIPVIIEKKLQDLRAELAAPLEVAFADDAMDALRQYCCHAPAQRFTP